MDNIFENTQGTVSLELADFYNKSFMVNGDPNLSSLMPSANPSVPDSNDEFSKLANQLNTNSKVISDKFSNPQGNFNDPFAQARVYGFNPSFKGLNMDRYNDKELGFDPFRDNEKFYNDNTSIFYDFGRAFKGMGRLGYGAFVDSATSLGRMVQGDFDISEDFALDSERIMAETMSTKSGFLPGVANFITNAGFTVGMMTEMLVEEALIAGVSGLTAIPTGGASLAAGGFLASLRAGMTLTKVGTAWRGMGNLRKALTSLDDISEARRYFTQFGKNTIDFVNPLQRTTDLFVGGNKLTGLGQMAQLSKGFGAFFRDVRDMNRSLSEARLEGGFVSNKMFDDLVNEHIERTGKEPNAQEIEGIKNIAHDAGITTELINLPVIHYTNNITFGNLSRPLTKFIGGMDQLKILGSRFGFVGDTFQELEKGFIQSARRNLNPRNIGRNTLGYFSANLAEGLQEVFQEATAVATEDYYKTLYFNENSIAKKMNELSWLDSYGLGLESQMSAQGAEVFASGFFMGGVMNRGSKAILGSSKYILDLVNDKRAQAKGAKDPEFKLQYETQKLEKEQKIKQAKQLLVESINTLYKDPNKLFAKDLENMTAQEILDKKIRMAGANNDRKFLIDFTDESFFKHVQTALQVGKFDSLVERLEGRLKLNDDELAQAMGVKDGEAARARLEVSIDRAKEIKRRYDLAPKNPVDLSKFKPNTKEYDEASILKHSFDLSVQDMMFSQVSFDRKLERMENITRDFANSDIISNTAAAPLMHLFGASNMIREIDLLVSEIQSFDPNDPKSKKIIDEKVSLLSKLNILATKIDEFTEYDKETRTNEEMAGEDIQNPKYAEAIREAFASYLEEYAKVNKAYVKADNVDSAFELLYDYYRLGTDANRLSRSVAVVSNPNFIKEEAARKFTTLKKIHENRKESIKKSVDKFFELITLNDVFAKLKDLGVAVDPEEALEFNLRQGDYTFTKFVNAKTLEPISKSNPLMKKINQIISDYEKEVGITEKKEAAAKEAEKVKKEEEVKKEAEEAKKAETKPVDDILAGLDSKTIKELRDAYKDIDRDDKESFEEFLDSPQAKLIITRARKGKEPEEKAEVPTTPISDKAKKAEEKLKQIWNSIGNGPGRNALEDGWAESFSYISETLSVGGENYQAHGMGKSGFAYAIRDLFELFNKGIDPSRGGGQLYTGPLAISEENKAAASAIGTAGGTAYTDGAFVLVAKKGVVGIKSIDDIGGILVNHGLTDINPEILTELRKAFPNLVIESYKNAKGLVEQLNKRAEQTTTSVSDIEGQVGTSNYSVDSGLIFYNNPDGTVIPVANPKGKPVMEVITNDIEKRKQEELSVEEYKPKNTIGYLPIPNNDGSFNTNSFSKTPNESNSMFQVEDLGNDRISVSFWNNNRAVQDATSSPELILNPFVKLKDALNQNTNKITTTKPAIFKKQGDKYVLEQKAEMYYSKPTKSNKEILEINAKYKAELDALEEAPVTSDIVSVYHHTSVKPEDFNFGSFQRGKQQVSQFGDGLNASSTTTPFLVQRYGQPIQGEVRDSEFIVIDANKTEKELYEELKAKGYKFNSPDGGSYLQNDPAKEYDGTEKANEQPAIISLFNDFQKSNPEIKGVKVINHIIGGQTVDPFYVIYDAKSFYGPGSLSKISALEGAKTVTTNKIEYKKPKSISVYLSSPNKDGSFSKSSEKTSFVDGASIYAFESIGNNRFNVYVSENANASKMALQFPGNNISPIFSNIDEDFSPEQIMNGKSLDVITPAVVELQGNKYVLISQGRIDLDNKLKNTKAKIETELTNEELDILAPKDLKSPFSELDPLYNGDKFILTEDGKVYFNESQSKQRAKRVSELKPEFSGDKRKGAIAAERGNVIDFLLRRFFEDRITADNINMAAQAFRKDSGKKKITFEPGFFDELFKKFELIKEEFDQKGWTIVSDLPTLFGNLGIDLYAGTTDLLARDKDGNYFIIDLKTSGSSRRADYEKQLLGESNYGHSTADRIQQNAYRELLKQRTGIEVKGLFILPLIVEGNIGIISGKFDSVELDTPADGSYLLPIDMSKNIYEILPNDIKFEPVEQTTQEFPVSPLIAGKIVYASSGIGKSTLVAKYPDQFVDMDQLLAEEFTAEGYEGFTANNIGSKIFELYKTNDFDAINNVIDNIYKNTFDKAKEIAKTGKTVLTGSARFASGKGSGRYADIMVKAESDDIIRKQLKAKSPELSNEDITSLISRIRQDESKGNILVGVTNESFLDFLQGNFSLSPLIARANSNSEIIGLEKLISADVSEEDLTNFMAKNQLMLERKQKFNDIQPGDLVELSINNGMNTITLVVDKIVPYYSTQTKIMFKENSAKIKDLIPTKSFSIVDVIKPSGLTVKPEVSPEAEKNAKDNVEKMDDFTSETDRLKKLLEEDFNEDDLFNGAEDPDNCNI